jgi:autotransporter passenger strand-loop-strand repeat protein
VEVYSGGLLRVGALGFGAGGLVSKTRIDSGALEIVDSGGTDLSATINASAALIVFSRGTAIDTTISGGTLVVSSGGSLGGKVTFAGSGGSLLIGGTAMPAAVISGFTTSDTIDLANVPYDNKYGFAVLVSGTTQQTQLDIVENNKAPITLNFTLAQSPKDLAGYIAGVYCLPGQALKIAKDVPGAAFWITHTVFSVEKTAPLFAVPNGKVILPTPAPSKSGYAAATGWQYVINTYSFSPNVSLNKADLDSFTTRGTAIAVVPHQPIANKTVNDGQFLDVASDVAANNTLINAGGIEKVYGPDVAAQINDGGYQYVWGTAAGAIAYDPGVQVVAPDGLATGTILSGGEQDVFGSAVGTTVSVGVLTVESGGIVNGAVLSGGTEIVSAGGIDFGTTISSGGVQLDYGVASGVAIFGGLEVVASGGTASGTTVFSGGVLALLSGGNATNLLLGSGGTLQVGSGKVLSGFVVSGARTLDVLSAGSVKSTTILDGGSEILNTNAVDSAAKIWGGTLSVGSGARTVGASAASGGSEVVSGGNTAINTVISSGGMLVIEAAGIASSTRGGTEIVSAGATDKGAQISAGYQDVNGFATSATIRSGGTEVVEPGGTASAVTVSSGGVVQLVGSSTIAGLTPLAGAALLVGSGYTLSNLTVEKE